ncbi:hypothetical protein QTH87_23390 [Variovorax sp. J22P168]|uniref:hypothetical protein n=1 Tax=Variovorax jilinensis TaxID=3053513 RepID=UPI0025790306|nr:hypothetical protein [Variovorax sp. J22P168]MDM0015407.1 hypothetical protein [Variovorax sp. J22P168]
MNRVTVDLYQSVTDPEKFLALPTGTDPTVLTAPMLFDPDFGEVKRYRQAFEFDPEQAYAGVDAAKIAADILTVKWSMYGRSTSSAAMD